MKYLLFLFLTAFSLMAGESLVWNNTSRTITASNVPDSNDIRLEFRVRNYQLSASTTVIAQLNFFDIQITNYSNRIEISTGRSDGNNTCQFFTSELSNDMVIRMQIIVSPRYIHCEKWNTGGGGYVYKFRTPPAWSSSGSANGTLGGLSVNPGNLDFMRGYTTTVPVGSKLPTTSDVGNYFDWKMDGNGDDSSGNGRVFAVGASSFEPTPVIPPVAVPQTSEMKPWADYIPLRAGYENSLNGTNSYSMSDTSSTVTCQWVQLDHAPEVSRTSTVVWGNQDSCSPTVNDLIFGPYKFRLQVTDVDDNKAQADLSAGAVSYQDDGIVIYPDDRMYRLIGPQQVLGQGSWEWLDSQWLAMAKANWAKYEIFGGPWYPEWMKSIVLGVPRTGTAYTLNSTPTKLYGIGTNFLIYCGGSPGPVIGTRQVAIEGAPGQWYARVVSSCQSDTELTVSSAFEAFMNIGSPGVRWGTYGFDSNRGVWTGQGASNINYYDVALGHYRWYLKSGDYRALQAFRWLADSWANNLFMTAGLVQRDRPMVGILARQLFDGGIGGLTEEQAWAVLRRMRNTAARASSSAIIDDPRESFYSLWSWALTAIYDPNETERNAAKDIVALGYTQRWAPQQQVGGNYIDSGEYGDRDGRTVIVTNGSATVTKHSGSDFPSNYCGVPISSPGSVSVADDRVSLTGTGTSLTGSNGRRVFLRGTLDGVPWSMLSRLTVTSETTATLQFPWRGDLGSITDYQIINGPVTNTENAGSYYNTFYWKVNSSGVEANPREVDNEWYWCRRVSGSEITLDKPYSGDTSGGNIYRKRTILNSAGRGTIPFHMGIGTIAFTVAADSLEGYNDEIADGYRSLRHDLNEWLDTVGYMPSVKGMRYLSGFSNCKVPEIYPAADCWGFESIDVDRSYLVESFFGGWLEYSDGNTSIRPILDEQYTASFSVVGYSSPFPGDGHYASLIANGNWTQDAALTKNYGQAYGVGGSSAWAAGRIGNVNPPELNTVLMKIDFPSGVSEITIYQEYSNGDKDSIDCSESPCSIELVVNKGDVLLTLEYKNSLGVVVLKSSEPVVFRN